MLRIERIVVREIGLPLREPFRISSGSVHERRICLVEVHQDGVRAWAECVAFEHPNYSAETLDTAWLAIRQWIGPRLLGRRLEGPGQVHAVLDENFCGHRMARAAVEMGCWALTAELQGRSLARLLGGERARIATGISLGIQATPDLLVEKARAARAEGYRKIKVKIEPGADVEHLAAVRRSLANSAYTLGDAEHLARLDELDLLMIEQPLGRDDLVRHAALQRRLRTPLCLDESITCAEAAEDMIALGSGRIVNIKAGRVGGFAPSIAIHDLCERSGVPVWCGGMLESGIGRAHNVALASLPNFTLPGDLSPSARYWERDIVTPEWTMDAEGMVRVPLDRPGIGVTVDVDRVEDLTVRRETLTAR
jgi:o-succinylbenzoate synthase